MTIIGSGGWYRYAIATGISLGFGGTESRMRHFFLSTYIRLGTILGRFSINYFSGLGLRILVRVWVRVPG